MGIKRAPDDDNDGGVSSEAMADESDDDESEDDEDDTDDGDHTMVLFMHTFC